MIYLTWIRQASFCTTEKGQASKRSGMLQQLESKIRLTLSFSTNMVDDKEIPKVVWKLLNPHCFNCVRKKALPVEYHANKKAWMTSGIFKTWLNTEKFCYSALIFSFVMWNCRSCQPVEPLFCNHLTKELFWLWM